MFPGAPSPLVKPDMRFSRIRLSRRLSPRAFARSCATKESLAPCLAFRHSFRLRVESFSGIRRSPVMEQLFTRHSLPLQKHVSGNAPSLHGNCPASSLLWASPTPDRSRTCGYLFPQGVVVLTTPRRVSQVPRPILRCVSPPITPDSPPGVLACFFPGGGRLPHSPGGSPAANSVTRPNRVRFTATHTFVSSLRT